MSILNTPLETPAQADARAILANIQSVKTTVFGVLRDSQNRLSQDVLDVFGPLAGQIFAELEALVAYATARLTANGDTGGLAELSAIMAAMPPVTVNPDGTVTITPE